MIFIFNFEICYYQAHFLHLWQGRALKIGVQVSGCLGTRAASHTREAQRKDACAGTSKLVTFLHGDVSSVHIIPKEL